MQKQLVFIIGAMLIFVSGFRYYVGTDYRTYASNYNLYVESELSLLSQPGTSIVARVSALIYNDYATWFFLMALLTIGLIMFSIYQNSIDVYLSVILFVFMGMWHSSFNAVKQYAAIAILVYGHIYLIEKNFKKWVIVCIFASLFHITALLMIPIYFLVIRKIDWKQIVLLVSIGIFITLGYEVLFNIVALLKQGQSVITSDSAVGARDVNTLRILVNCAPAILYLFLKFSNHFKEDEKSNVYANFSVFNSVLYIATNSSVYLARFCAYTDIFGIFFMPYLLRCFSKKSRWFVVTVVLVLYFIFWRYDLMKGTSTNNFQWVFSR